MNHFLSIRSILILRSWLWRDIFLKYTDFHVEWILRDILGGPRTVSCAFFHLTKNTTAKYVDKQKKKFL